MPNIAPDGRRYAMSERQPHAAPGDQAMRKRTAAAHRRLDDSLDQLDLATVDGYTRFLAIMLAGFAPVEAYINNMWDYAPENAIRVDRSSLLRSDIATMMRDHGAVELQTRPLIEQNGLTKISPGTAVFLGTVYTVEGSRLGAKILRQRIPPQFPSAFLNDNKVMMPWPALRQMLRQLDTRDLNIAVDAAENIFSFFLLCADALLPPRQSTERA